MSPEQRRLFLSELAFTGNLAFSCRAACVSRREALVERDGHPDFERKWRLAERSAMDALRYRLELAR